MQSRGEGIQRRRTASSQGNWFTHKLRDPDFQYLAQCKDSSCGFLGKPHERRQRQQAPQEIPGSGKQQDRQDRGTTDMSTTTLRCAVVFKTYAWDEFVERQAHRLADAAGALDFFVSVDESNGPVGPIPFE